MQAPAAAYPSERVVLLHKRLSMSDLSDSVLLTGRIVLPRVQMELNVGRIIAAGSTGSSTANPDSGSAQYPLVVVDAQDRPWELLLKQWTAHSAPQPRPIFVLERTAGCMKANRASPGHFLQLWVDTAAPNVLRVNVLTAAQAAAAPAGASDWGAAAAAAGQALLAPGDSGLACMRSIGCARGAGHPGYCSTAGGSGSAADASQACPTWISLRCGSMRADLHVHTLRVSPLDSRGRVSSGGAISLAEFQRRASGGGGRSTQPISSLLPVIVDGTGMTLQRWLASWGLAAEGLGLAEGDSALEAGGAVGSAAEIESDVEAGEVLMSIMSGAGGGGGGGGAAASHTTLFPSPTKQEAPSPTKQEPEPVTPASKYAPAPAAQLTASTAGTGDDGLTGAQLVRPLAELATPQAMSALYTQLAAESAAGGGASSVASSAAAAAAATRLDQLTKRARMARYLAGLVLSAQQAAANQAAATAAAVSAAMSAGPAVPKPYPLQR